jgi:hypothetical protein
MNVPFVARAKGTRYKNTNHPTHKNVDSALTELLDKDGGTTKIGSPTDGSYEDGLIEFTSNTLVADAVDEMNEVLSELAPTPPISIDGVNLVSSRTLRTGKISAGLSADWYVGVSAGDTVSNIIEHASVDLSVANSTTTFARGDEGTLEVSYKQGISSVVSEAIIDIDANFVENSPGSSPPRPPVQDLSLWDNQGVGSITTNGIADMSSGIGRLEILEVATYNNFSKYQKMNARASIDTAAAGYNMFRLTHLLASPLSTNDFSFFYDNDATGLAFSVNPYITLNTLSSSKYLSGVRYFSTGDTFDYGFTATNIYRNVYHPTSVAQIAFAGAQNVENVNPAGVPNYDDTLAFSNTMTIDSTNEYSADAEISVSLLHPYKTPLTVESDTVGSARLVNTYGNVATDTQEYFRDENYRLPDAAYNSIPAATTGEWNSTLTLTNGNALVYNERIQYPNINLSTNTPVGNPDYSSGFSGDQVYLRAFSATGPKSSGVLTLSGLSVSNIGEIGSGDVNVRVKLPGLTGWMDAGKYYNASTFTGADGDGILVSKSGNDLSMTFGIFSTINSGDMIIVRISFRNTNRYVSGMNITW